MKSFAIIPLCLITGLFAACGSAGSPDEGAALQRIPGASEAALDLSGVEPIYMNPSVGNVAPAIVSMSVQQAVPGSAGAQMTAIINFPYGAQNYAWELDWNDGVVATGVTAGPLVVEHTYAVAGSFDVCLEVCDGSAIPLCSSNCVYGYVSGTGAAPAGFPAPCEELDDTCVVGTPDANGFCTAAPVTDGTACTDVNGVAGVCLAGSCDVGCTDADGDGFCTLDDCDDSNPYVNPDMPESADNGRDDNCRNGELVASRGRGVYVDGTGGDDTNSGDINAPVATLTQGVALAQLSGKAVYVAAGDYAGISINGGPSLRIFGGYDASNWTRNIQANLTRILPVYSNGIVATSVNIFSGAQLHLDGFTVVGGDNVSFVAGIEATESDLALSNCTVNGGGPNSVISEALRVDYLNHDGRLVLVNNSFVAGTGTGTRHAIELTLGSALFGSTMHLELFMRGNSVIGNGGARAFFVHVDSASLGGFVADNVFEIDHGYAAGFEMMVWHDGFASLQMVNNLLDATQTAVAFRADARDFGGDTSSIYLETVHNVFRAADNEAVELDGDIEALMINNVMQVDAAGYADALDARGAARLSLINNVLLEAGSFSCPVYTDSGCASTAADINACNWAECVQASGNIQLDPQLDAAGSPLPGSPCIDAGADPAAYLTEDYSKLDFEGDARPVGAAPNIGRDE